MRTVVRPIARPLARRITQLPGTGDELVSILFRRGEQGGWYDPSDLSTLFQDSAGTTPVTALGQPVGLILDKSRGLALGVELVVSQDLTNASWVSGGAFGNYAGSTATATTITTTGVSGARRFRFSCTPGQAFRMTCIGAMSGTASNAALQFAFGNSGATLILEGSPASATTSTTGAPLSVIAVAPANAAFCEIILRANGPSGSQATFTNISVRELAGNHLTQTTPTSRPLWQQTDGAFHLTFDGADDFLTCGTFNMSASDKVMVCAGVWKLSDAAAGIVAELSVARASNNGAFTLLAPSGAPDRFLFASKGTGDAPAGTSSAAFDAPTTRILTGIGDISGDSAILRINSVQAGQNLSDQGTGNFGAAYPLFVGRRGGTTLPFNGRLFGLVIRGGASGASEIAALERFMAQKTGIAV